MDGRYTIHELLRQYAANKLCADPQHLAKTQVHHCHYYVGFLGAREDALNDARQNETRREIATEIDNIRTAWKWALTQQQPNLLEPALESLRLFLEYAGWYSEAIKLFEVAVEAERMCTGDSSPLLGKLLARQAWFYHRLDRFEVARALIQQSLAILGQAQLSLPAEAALCWQCLGNMARVVGDFAQAIEHSRKSLAFHRTAGNSGQIAISLNTLAVAYAERGEFEESKRLHAECLALRQELGDRLGVATTLVNLGFIALGQAKYAEVKPLEREALAIFREIGYPMGEAVALNNLGVASYMLAEYGEARLLLEECLVICRELGHRHIAAHALGTLGGVAGASDDYDEAWQHTREGLQLAQAIGSVSATLFGLMSTAVLLSRQGQKEQAAEVAALVYHHASTNRETKDRASHLLDQLATQLPVLSMVAAQERGRRKKLEEVVLEIMISGV
jgi:tetratricopeptide (TPR) repeat protein